MIHVRVYRMPSTADERERLVAEITAMCSYVLGYPARQANIEGWRQQELAKLRLTHEKWCDLSQRINAKTPQAAVTRQDFTLPFSIPHR